MLEIKCGEVASFEFGLELSGDATGALTTSFSVVHPAGYSVRFPVDRLEGGMYRVSFPLLDAIFPPGEHECALEVIVGDRYFKPFTEVVKLIEPLKAVVTSVAKVNATPAPTVTAVSAVRVAPEAAPLQTTPMPAPPTFEAAKVTMTVKPTIAMSEDQKMFDALLKRK